MKKPSPPGTPLGSRLKEEMSKRGVTSAELARRAGVKTSFLYDILSGKSANPSTVTLARVADALDVSLAWLAGNGGAADGCAGGYITVSHLAGMEATADPCRFRRDWLRDSLGVPPTALRLLAVRDDSMEPSLYRGDSLLIDTTRRQPSPPGIFVVSDGQEPVPRRLEYVMPAGIDAPRVRIAADNPRYGVYERSPEEACIIGRVIWLARVI